MQSGVGLNPPPISQVFQSIIEIAAHCCQAIHDPAGIGGVHDHNLEVSKVLGQGSDAFKGLEAAHG